LKFLGFPLAKNAIDNVNHAMVILITALNAQNTELVIIATAVPVTLTMESMAIVKYATFNVVPV
jgi:hypothetical protein